MSVDNPPFINENKWLIDAVKILKGKGIIKRDKEICDKLDYSKVSISNMLSGNTAISYKFKTLFMKEYGKFLELNADMLQEAGVSYEPPEMTLPQYKELQKLNDQVLNTQQNLISGQKEMIDILVKRIEHLEEIILKSYEN